MGSIPDSLSSLTQLQKLCARLSKPHALAELMRSVRRLLADSGLCGKVPMPHQPDDGPLPDCPTRYAPAGLVLKRALTQSVYNFQSALYLVLASSHTETASWFDTCCTD
jgi:hypothetical protein